VSYPRHIVMIIVLSTIAITGCPGGCRLSMR